MTNNEWYSKGYDDGFSDAINNIELGDILENIKSMPIEDKQKILEVIESCN